MAIGYAAIDRTAAATEGTLVAITQRRAEDSVAIGYAAIDRTAAATEGTLVAITQRPV